MFLRCVAPRAGAALVAVMSAAGLCTAVAPAQAAPSPPPCPASVVPGVPALPGAVGVLERHRGPDGQARERVPDPGPHRSVGAAAGGVRRRDRDRGAIRPVSRVLAAARDAGRRCLHRRLGRRCRACHARGCLPRAGRRAPRALTPSTPATSRRSVPTVGPGSTPGWRSVRLGRDLLAFRAGDRDESITYTPAPLTPGGWTFAPPPSLQSAQTPWVADDAALHARRARHSSGRPRPRRCRAPMGARSSTRRRPTGRRRAPSGHPAADRGRAVLERATRSTSTTRRSRTSPRRVGWTLVDTARVLAMGNVVGADAGIACWDAKYHYRFWRPIMAIRNAGIDGNPATIADPAWTPLLTTPNHPEYPAAHGCLTGSEAEVLATVAGPGPVRVHDPRVRRRDDGQLDRGAEVRAVGRPAGADRERPRLGRAALPRIGSRRRAGRNRRGTVDARSLLRARARP